MTYDFKDRVIVVTGGAYIRPIGTFPTIAAIGAAAAITIKTTRPVDNDLRPLVVSIATTP